MNILVADDNQDALYLLQTLLVGHGHDVTTAANGEEALLRARANPPDLIISDILMPVMDGFQLCREIRRDDALRNVVFVFYTATYTQQSDAEFAATLGADDFIRKPSEPNAFLERITQVIENSSQGRLGHEPVAVDDVEVLRLYSERLVAKLEKRSLDLQDQIAERERVEQSLREALHIINQSPAVVFLWRNELGGPVEYVSDNVETVFGYSAEDLLEGRLAFSDMVHPDDLPQVRREIDEHREECDRTGFTHLPYRIITESGQTKWVDDRTSIRRDSGGAITHFQGILVDVTDRIRSEQERLALEAQLRQTQKLESIGTLASGVAHEINNPLTGIINYADLIRSRVGEEELRQFAAGIMEEGDRIATIVRSLLSFARQDKEAHSPAHIGDIVEASLALVGSLLRKDQIAVELRLPEDLPKIQCRSQQIQQVVVNLLTNARDALNERYPDYNEDKLVQISCGVVQRDGVNWVRTTIEDHGVGIPEDAIGNLFDPFFTTKPKEKGTGLGLSVSFGIVREHAGELQVETEAGSFTRFHILLPVRSPPLDKPTG